MCYNLSQVIDDIEKAVSKGFKIPKKSLDRYWKLTGHEYPVASIFIPDGKNNFEHKNANWGLIPRWTQGNEKALSIREYTLNATIESANEKPSYKHLLSSNRCIILASGFFEWREVNKQKFPYYIYPADDSFFSIAGLWDEWKNPMNGEIVNSFTILTTAANPMMEFIHNRKKRMPVILTDEQLKLFADPKVPMEEFVKPFSEEKMKSHTIGKLITSRTENPNVPEVIKPFEHPELNELFHGF